MRRTSGYIRSSGYVLVMLTTLSALRICNPAPAHATPAYARRYDLKCATCHSPIPPRLNNVGMLFRRSGFRLPDSDENGKYTLKMIPAHGIGDALAISAKVSAQQDPAADPGTSRSTMQMGEVALFGGTAIDDHLSSQLIYLARNSEGSSELEDAELTAMGGTPENMLTLRAGLAQTMLWQKGNNGSLTDSPPLVLDEVAVGPVGDFGGFGLGRNQMEVEAGYTYTRMVNGRLMSTMLSAAALNGVTETGDRADRNPTDGVDVLLQAVQLFGSRNTLGAFYYRGRTVIDPLGLLATPGPFRETFTRYGAQGDFSPLDRIDLVGSVVAGQDDSKQLGRTVNTVGGYAEVEAEILDRWVAVYRWEQADPDRDTGGDLVRADVISTSYQLWDHLFFTGEYRQVHQADTKPHTLSAIVRLIY